MFHYLFCDKVYLALLGDGKNPCNSFRWNSCKGCWSMENPFCTNTLIYHWGIHICNWNTVFFFFFYVQVKLPYKYEHCEVGLISFKWRNESDRFRLCTRNLSKLLPGLYERILYWQNILSPKDSIYLLLLLTKYLIIAIKLITLPIKFSWWHFSQKRIILKKINYFFWKIHMCAI